MVNIDQANNTVSTYEFGLNQCLLNRVLILFQDVKNFNSLEYSDAVKNYKYIY